MKIEHYGLYIKVYSDNTSDALSVLPDDALLKHLDYWILRYYSIKYQDQFVCSGHYTSNVAHIDMYQEQYAKIINITPNTTFRDILLFVVGRNMERLLLQRALLDKYREHHNFLEQAARAN